MDELLDPDELRDSVRKLLARTGVHTANGGLLWQQIVEAGWLGLGVPEEHGGLAQPFTALAVVYMELGRALAPSDLAGTLICLDALAHEPAGDPAYGELIRRTLAGEARPVFVPALPGALELTPTGLTGVIRNALDVDTASHILVPLVPDAQGLALIPLPHPAVRLVSRATWDVTRGVCDVAVENLQVNPGDCIGTGGTLAPALSCQFELALACDAIGGAQAIFDETLQYLLVRRQFGRPIASFQALKHRCAQMHAEMQAASSLVSAACRAFSVRVGEWSAAAVCSRLYASEVYREITEEAIQLHGGIGFTWEHRCHRFLKRARLNDVLAGTPEQRKDAVAPQLFRAAAATPLS